AHDVKAMLAAGGSNAGVFYLCNPNNPTGTLTAREDIEYLVKNKPAGSIVMIDEAYIHFSDAKPCTDMVAAGKDVIVLRTFSKIYGMAGLRAGAAFGRTDLLGKMMGFGTGYTPSTGMVAGFRQSFREGSGAAEEEVYAGRAGRRVFVDDAEGLFLRAIGE
ncbi:MAG: aminotransferase class I/II-fold pyridoxal phosphate-dependent enzyme, partial [Paludibaculum sp.]